MTTLAYQFDGELLTFAQICARVPLIRDRRTLEKHLRGGRNTKLAVTCHNPTTDIRSGARRGSHAWRSPAHKLYFPGGTDK